MREDPIRPMAVEWSNVPSMGCRNEQSRTVKNIQLQTVAGSPAKPSDNCLVYDHFVLPELFLAFHVRIPNGRVSLLL